MQWLSAFKIAIEHSGELVRYQRSVMDRRRLARQEEREGREEEELLGNTELDQTRNQLEQEKLVRKATAGFLFVHFYGYPLLWD